MMISKMMEAGRSHFMHINMQVGERILCCHPFNESKRAYVVPQRVEELLKCFWHGPGMGSGYVKFFDIENYLKSVLLFIPQFSQIIVFMLHCNIVRHRMLWFFFFFRKRFNQSRLMK